ncbi:MAG: hypothetical protein ABIT83_27115 [Massilia sp.]
MLELSPAAAQCHAEFLRRVLEHAHRDSNVALEALAAERAPDRRSATQAEFRYVDPRDGSTQAIPAAQFHRQYALCLHALELTIYGYCIERTFGWERRLETVFSTRRPARWRRMLRPAPLMALRVQSGSGGASVSVGAAQRQACASRAHLIVRLDESMQEELAQAHAAEKRARSVKVRLLAWLARWRGKSRP